MSPVLPLSLRSIANRRLSVALTVVAVALAVALLLGVERLRNDARAGFAQTLSGTDLVVGARSGPVFFKSCGWAGWDLAAARCAVEAGGLGRAGV